MSETQRAFDLKTKPRGSLGVLEAVAVRIGALQGVAVPRVPKAAIVVAVQAMDPNARYHLFTFDSEARQWNKKPVPPTADAIRALHDMLGQFHAKGGTNIYQALLLALQLDQLRFGELGQQRVDELFLLSDGEPTIGAVKDPEAILALIREANKYQKVRINTVFAGFGPGADFLRRLAAENDGVFVQR